MKALLFSGSLILIASLSSLAQQQQQPQPASPASPARARGIALYQQNDAKGAIKVLREAVKKDKNDADAWYFLGLALTRQGQMKDARSAFVTTIGLRPNFAQAHTAYAYALLVTGRLPEAMSEAHTALDLGAKDAQTRYLLGNAALRQDMPATALDEATAILKIDPKFAPALLLKAMALLHLQSEDINRKAALDRKVVSAKEPEQKSREERIEYSRKSLRPFKEAADAIEKYIQLVPSGEEADLWREQLATLRAFSQVADEDIPESQRTIFFNYELDKKATILTRPEPRYTDRARNAWVQGTVVVRAVLAADGQVKYIMALSGLPYGLTEEAIKVARRIKFVPAVKDGRAVSQYVQIEYNFNLY
jgi:TonB family protein